MGLLDLFHSKPDYFSTDIKKAMAMLDRIEDQKTLRKIATDKKMGNIWLCCRFEWQQLKD